MENTNNQETKCCFSKCCGAGKHGIFRWILGIIILVAVFSFGIKLGEFKAYLKGGYGYKNGGYYNMMRQGDYSGKNFYGPGMMRGFYGNYPYSTTTP